MSINELLNPIDPDDEFFKEDNTEQEFNFIFYLHQDMSATVERHLNYCRDYCKRNKVKMGNELKIAFEISVFYYYEAFKLCYKYGVETGHKLQYAWNVRSSFCHALENLIKIKGYDDIWKLYWLRVDELESGILSEDGDYTDLFCDENEPTMREILITKPRAKCYYARYPLKEGENNLEVTLNAMYMQTLYEGIMQRMQVLADKYLI